MKHKIIAIFMALVMSVSMASCSLNGSGTSSNPSSGPFSSETGNSGNTSSTNPSSDLTSSETSSDSSVSSDTGSESTSSGTASQEPTSSDGTSSVPHTHKYTAKIVAPTCAEKGYTEHTCSCGQSYTDTPTAALGHDVSKVTVIVQPTYTSTGVEKHSCTRCSYFENKTLPKLDKPVTPPPSTSSNPSSGSSSEVHYHKYTSKVTAPTCTKNGYTTYTCACGNTYTDNTVPAIGHNLATNKVFKEATTKETGIRRYYCSRCSYTKDEAIPKLHEHKYTSKVTAPTCTQKGYTTYTCSCGHSYTGNSTAATGHNLATSKVITEATISSTGVLRKYCNRCSYTEDEVIPKLEHTHRYEAVVTPASCTEPGYTTFTCACGHTYKANETEIRGHVYLDCETIQKPTTEEPGIDRYFCTFCDHYKDVEIPKLKPVTGPLASQATVAELEAAIFKHLNKYRTEANRPATTWLPRLAEVCRYRSKFLVDDFNHSTAITKQVFTKFKYGNKLADGKYDFATGQIIYNGEYYYAISGGMEAISMGGFGNYTVDQWGEAVAASLRNSASHWGYVGSAEYAYMAVGVHVENGIGYVTTYVMESNKYETMYN